MMVAGLMLLTSNIARPQQGTRLAIGVGDDEF
jgi:hypothetical protein